MNVVISTVGRYHLFALARELHARGRLRKISPAFPGLPWRGKVCLDISSAPIPFSDRPRFYSISWA